MSIFSQYETLWIKELTDPDTINLGTFSKY
jgi:hypothetical protein